VIHPLTINGDSAVKLRSAENLFVGFVRVHVDLCRSTTKTSRSEALDKKIAKIQVRLASARERFYSYRIYFDPIKFFACAMPIFGEIAKRVRFNVHIYLCHTKALDSSLFCPKINMTFVCYSLYCLFLCVYIVQMFYFCMMFDVIS
jgi:hypothetical protein